MQGVDGRPSPAAAVDPRPHPVHTAIVARCLRLPLLVVVVAALAAASGASASVRLGPDLTPVQNGPGYGCQALLSPCTYVNVRSTGTVAVAAPFDGVVTKWRFRVACCTEAQSEPRTLTLKTYKQGANDGQEGYGFVVPVNTGPSFVIPPGNQVQADAPVQLPARLPIAAGERVGIVADSPIFFASYATPDVTLTIPANGVEYLGQQYGVAYAGALAINAELEPDADGDGFGDETQDCKPADPGSHEACAGLPTGPTQSPPAAFVPGGKCSGACGGGATLRGPVQTIPGPRGDGGVEIQLACPANATAPCGGILYAELPGGKKPRPFSRAAAAPKQLGKISYKVMPGKKRALELTFNRKVSNFLAQKPTRRVTVTVDPRVGRSITRTIVLHFKPR